MKDAMMILLLLVISAVVTYVWAQIALALGIFSPLIVGGGGLIGLSITWFLYQRFSRPKR